MSKTNVSHQILDRYLSHLVEDGLLEVKALEKSGKSLYKTTEKGKIYLNSCISHNGHMGGIAMLSLFRDDRTLDAVEEKSTPW